MVVFDAPTTYITFSSRILFWTFLQYEIATVIKNLFKSATSTEFVGRLER